MILVNADVFLKGDPATVEEIAANWQQIHEPGDYGIPQNNNDPMKVVLAAVTE